MEYRDKHGVLLSDGDMIRWDSGFVEIVQLTKNGELGFKDGLFNLTQQDMKFIEEAVTVLYSFTHGVTGESMHFIRHDTAYVGALDKKLHGMVKHEAITDAELQEMKRCIV